MYEESINRFYLDFRIGFRGVCKKVVSLDWRHCSNLPYIDFISVSIHFIIDYHAILIPSKNQIYLQNQ